ncbi:ABC transporter permease [Propylenella binzhouense]|uniref:ABC transporter permease n=1 Tax=Propylenella binzhouense TaxID=2555902 RepID=A0A964T6H9_9HYPH|nr:ABC transporter permease [Propylenella binzhouense]MYZ49320.1 ABC transporter permease [Propylenella binzhouense]
MNGARLPLVLRLALRELRGGLAGFYVFLACIALGVGAIAGVNSVSRALTDGIAVEGRVILGGDIAFSLIQREADAEELAFLRERGEVGTIATLRSMVRRTDGEGQALVELKAVDSAYPHGGTLETDPPGEAADLLGAKDGTYGALAAPELLDRLGVAVGDAVSLGGGTFRIRGTIRAEPDLLSTGIGFGPRLMVSIDGLRGTSLLRPGSLVTWHYRVRLPGGEDRAVITRTAEQAKRLFPEAGWGIRSRENASPSLSRNIVRFSQFLTLVGLTALVVGGVGVANAVASFVDLKRPAIATLKCLGASRRLVFRLYLLQIVLIALLGIAAGLAIGAILPFVAKAALAGILPVGAAPDIYPRELALAFLYGLLVAVAFSLWPLGRARQLPASGLFADRALHAPVRPPAGFRIVQAALFAALAALAVALSSDRYLAAVYVGGVVASFVVLRAVSAAVISAARRSGSAGPMTLRLAIRNIHRPGALTGSVVLSLGLGLTLLVTLALIDGNIRNQITGTIAETAPDFFFVDIQNAEKDAFEARLAALAPQGKVAMVPMLRGRFVSIKGVPASEIDPPEEARWALRGDRGLTYSDTLPENSRLVSGSWWPAGYEGEPLVSFESEIADALGLKVGDEITVNALGRNVTARVANTRSVEWESLSINFVMVFSPNTFRGAPHAYLATLRLPGNGDPARDDAILRDVTTRFPAITSIRVRDALDAVNAVVADLALAVRVAASLAIVVSMLVLGGALAAGHRQRRQDAVILKTLGATRRTLLTAFSLEYGVLGLATAVFAVAAGSVGAWYVVSRIMRMDFTMMPTVALSAVLLALLVTLGLGLAGTWRILSVKAGPYLRNL